jgi:hypothetical protein
MKIDAKLLGLLAVLVAAPLFLVAQWRPAYFTNVTILGGLLLMEVVVVTVWHYERWFFTVMMLVFLWAGSSLPLSGTGGAVRWVFLGVGALVGFVKWAESDRRAPFNAIHLVALLCVLSATVSAFVSNRTETSLLKSASLFLLFLYQSCGVRVAVSGREGVFFPGLVTACEAISYLSALFYGVAHFQVFGNPNSLGAIMGVVVVPILLWAVLTTDERHVRNHRSFALCLAAYLLYSSVSRAAILACAAAVTLMCIALRRQHLLIKGAFVLVFVVAIVAVAQPAQFDALSTAFTDDLIYKGKPKGGILGSRASPWQDTVDVIKQSPWFGSGFGTDEGPRPSAGGLLFATPDASVREHGNSYLALLEYVGLLGITPFLVLLGLVLHQIYRGCSRMWRTRDPRSYAVPLVLVCTAGLVHAFFEDWLFAVGYYLNVFFWTSVFVLAELQAQRVPESVRVSRAWSRAPVIARQVPLSSGR